MLVVAAALLVGVGSSAIQAGGAQSAAVRAPQVPANTSSKAFVDAYCVTCHNQRLKTADLALDTLDPSAPAANAAVWEKVLRKVRTGAMPPPQARHPDKPVAEAFTASLEASLDRAAAASLDPGRTPAVRRLNRTEYQNAVRDLLAIDSFPKEMDMSLLLPADDIGEGFDNMADALFVSPTLIERYLGAARKISRLAVPDLAIPRMIDSYQMSGQLPQDVHFDELPFGTRGGVLIRRTFPVDGLYTFALQVARGGVYDPSTSSERFEIELTIDGERVKLFTEERAEPAAGGGRGRRGGGGGAALQVQLAVKAGPHDIGAAFLERADAPLESLVLPYRRGRGLESAALSSVTISGPDEATGVGDTPSRRRIFVCHPGAASDAGAAGAARPVAQGETACAQRIISTLARRAFRHPARDRAAAGQP